MALRVDYKRSQLRLIYLRLAPAAAKSLQLYLLDGLASLPSSVAGVGAVRSSSGNGHAVEFFGANEGAVSLSDSASLYSELLDIYDQARAALISSGIATPSDSQIYEEMMDRLRNVTVECADFSGIREEAAL